MLLLTANNTPLDISRIGFNLTRRSPMAENAGSYVYSFTIPYTIPNARVFGFPKRLQRLQKVSTQVPGEIKWNGKIIQEGLWSAKSSGGQTISIEMLIDAGVFANSIAGKTLPDLFDVPITTTDIVAHVEAQVLQTWPEVNHNFPVIYNPGFYGDPKETDPDKNKNLQFEGFLNNYDNGGVVLNNAGNINAISPQLYLAYMLQHINGQYGYTISGNVLQNTMIKAAMIPNCTALDKLSANTFEGQFAGFTASPFVIIWNTNIKDPGNHYNAATGEYNAISGGAYAIHLNLHAYEQTPQAGESFNVNVVYNGVVVYSKIVTMKVGEAFDYTLIADITHDVTAADVGNNFTISASFNTGSDVPANLLSAACSIVNTLQPYVNIFANDFNYKNHVPEVDVKEFLAAVYNSFNILPFTSEATKTVELLFFDDILKQNNATPYPKGLHRDSLKVYSNNYKGIAFNFNFQGSDQFAGDMTEQSVKGTAMRWLDIQAVDTGDVWFVTSLNAYYRRDFDKDTGLFENVPIGDKNPELKIDDGQQTKEIPLPPMLMRTPHVANYAYRNVPAINMLGTSEAWQLKNDMPLRIMFWVGMTSGFGYAYPLASSTKYDTAGNIVLPHSWTLPDIEAAYFSEYVKWLKNRLKIEFTNEITAAFMSKLSFSQQYAFQNARILLEEAYTKLSDNQLGPVKVTGWTV